MHDPFLFLSSSWPIYDSNLPHLPSLLHATSLSSYSTPHHSQSTQRSKHVVIAHFPWHTLPSWCTLIPPSCPLYCLLQDEEKTTLSLWSGRCSLIIEGLYTSYEIQEAEDDTSQEYRYKGMAHFVWSLACYAYFDGWTRTSRQDSLTENKLYVRCRHRTSSSNVVVLRLFSLGDHSNPHGRTYKNGTSFDGTVRSPGPCTYHNERSSLQLYGLELIIVVHL